MSAAKTIKIYSGICVLAAVFPLALAIADDLPDAPTPQFNQMASEADPTAKAMAHQVCTSFQGKDCDVKTMDTGEGANHFYANVMMSWEYSFGEKDWAKKLVYNGAYRVTDKSSGRQYDVLRFDNEQGLPVDEPADTGTATVHDSAYVNDIKAYQTQQKEKDGKYADDDDDLTKKSLFVGETVDEMDYDRRVHYFLAIPVGWDRSYTKRLGKVTMLNDNEVAVGGLAYAGVFHDDGMSTGHYGANLIRTDDSVSFNFGSGDSTFTVKPMEFTNECAVFSQGLNCEWDT
jgi:hypothetical protein